MKAVLAILVAFVLVAFGIVWRTLTTMCQEEMRTRLDRLPYTLLRLAALRLPREARDDLADEWASVLDDMLADTEGLPLTRLRTGLHFAAGLLRVGPSVARELTGTPQHRLRTAARRAHLLVALFGSVFASISAVGSIRSHHISAGTNTAVMGLGFLFLLVALYQRVPRRASRFLAVSYLMAGAGFFAAGFWWFGIFGVLAAIPEFCLPGKGLARLLMQPQVAHPSS
jgi:hypothetical protein